MEIVLKYLTCGLAFLIHWKLNDLVSFISLTATVHQFCFPEQDGFSYILSHDTINFAEYEC